MLARDFLRPERTAHQRFPAERSFASARTWSFPSDHVGVLLPLAASHGFAGDLELALGNDLGVGADVLHVFFEAWARSRGTLFARPLLSVGGGGKGGAKRDRHNGGKHRPDFARPSLMPSV